MADNFTDFYTGNMAPPLKLPGGGYAPAPLAQPQMSPEQIYEGIYGEPLTLSSRSVKTVPVPVSASADARFGVGTGMRGAGDAAYRAPKTFIPNDLPGPEPVPKYEDRLPALPAGLPLQTDIPGFASARGRLGAGGFGSGSLTATPPSMSDPVHQLNVDVADAEGQMYADNMGMPVRSKSGKVYAPKQAYTPKALSDVRATASKVTASRGLLATLLGGLSNAPQQARGGGLGSLLSGGQVTRAPLAGNPMVVDPGTRAGSTLESMGFSSGAVLPSAVVENLSSRGYI